jgi:hypothetical protein
MVSVTMISRARFLCGVVLTLIGLHARANVYIDKQMITHCGAMLLAGRHAAVAPAVDLQDLLRRWRVDPAYAGDRHAGEFDVQTLDLSGWNDQRHREASDHRLAWLLRDLDQAPAVLSVAVVSRGDQIADFLDRLSVATETLDHEVQRQAEALALDPGRSLVEGAAAAAWLVGGWHLGEAVQSPGLGATVQSAGIVGAAYIARGPAARLWSAWFPAHVLDLRRVRVDSHLRTVDRTSFHRAHIGLTIRTSGALVDELLRARDWTELTQPHWARRLAEDAARPDDVLDARLLVDHLSAVDPATGEAILFSVVRVIRAIPRPGARGRDPRPSPTWLSPVLRPAPSSAPVQRQKSAV